MNQLSSDFRKRCEVIASGLREQLDVRLFDPLSADRLAKHLGIIVRSPDRLDMPAEVVDYFLTSENWWGIIFPTKPPIIVYNPAQSPARYQSTIMHEIAHFLLKHPSERIYFAPDGSFTRDVNSVIEAEAAYLGSCLQIPRRGLLWAEQKGMNIEEIALHFGASVEMVRWRQNVTIFGY